MATAIELYQKAYDLDYREGDWESAEEIYRKIIERFPHSEEKEYAQVHLDRLEKLKGNPEDFPLKPVTKVSSGGTGLSIFNFVLSLLIIGVVGISAYMLWLQYQKDNYTDLLLDGLLSQRSGYFKEAAVSYKRAQAALPKVPMAHRFMAELRLEEGQFSLADKELQRWERISPQDGSLKLFKQRLAIAKQNQK